MELVIPRAGGRKGGRPALSTKTLPWLSGLCFFALSHLVKVPTVDLPKALGVIPGPSQHPQTHPCAWGSWAAVGSAMTERWESCHDCHGRSSLPLTCLCSLHTQELLCFSPDVGQPGTEIFNMPAITGAGNSPHTCTSFPTGLTAMASRRLHRFKHLLFLFSLKTECNSCWEAEASGHTITPCCWVGDRAVQFLGKPGRV